MILVPARKVPLRYNGISGFFPSVKNGREMAFESPLERNFMLLLEFEASVCRYTEQPVQIPYQKTIYKGGPRVPEYTPDLLVYYNQSHFEQPRWPDLVEIKPIADFKKLEQENADKYVAAELFGMGKNWHFVKWSDEDIHPQRLVNANYFYSAFRAQRYPQIEQKIIDYLSDGDEVLGRDVTEHFNRTPEFVSSFRYLIATKRITTNWEVNISLASTFKLTGAGHDV